MLRTALWRERTHPSAVGNNLPLPPTPLVGRDAERARALNLLGRPHVRILTLFGTGGVGKTRLSLALAADLAPTFPDGVFFVPLQDITDPGLLLSAISQALELYTLPDETLLPTLIGYMRDMGALLLLDNFEQLTPAAPILSELLSACPRLRLLITSRAILNLRGEQELEIQPLPLPVTSPGNNHAPKGATDLAAIESSPAVQLFVQRARSVKPGFNLDNDNAPVVAEICARLDGLPLAMELAAARIKLLSPRALLARLDKRLQVLTGGAQDLPSRQQTLQNAIHWSYELLTPDEQRVFRQFAVFSGGCTLEAAESICRLPLLDLATSLANKSLLRVVENDDDEPRLVMLETVREYAHEQLRSSGEEAATYAALAQYMLSLAEEAGPQLIGPDQVQWLDKLEREIGNLRVALEWSISTGDGTGDSERLETGLRIAGQLTRFWNSRSHIHEAREWLDALLRRTTSMRTEARERALRAAGRLAKSRTMHEQSRLYYQEALELARERGDPRGIAGALMGLANNLWAVGDMSGLAAYQECLQVWTDLGWKPGIAGALNNIGLVMLNTQDPSAISYLERSLHVFSELRDTERIALCMDSLGRAYLQKGDLDTATRFVRQALDMNLIRDDQWDIAYGLISLAEISCAGKNHRRAALLLAAANATYDDLTARLDQYDLAGYTECAQSGRQALGSELFDEIWSRGLKLTPDQAIADGTAQGPSTPMPGPPAPGPTPKADPGLSEREIEVLALLAQGHSNAELAERLFLSLYTINAHLRTIYRKLNVSSRAAATRYALEHGLA